MNAPKNKAISELFRQKGYRSSLISNTVSRLGDSIDSIAFGWMVYQLTGSMLLMGSIFAVSGIPNLLFGFMAGVFVDRVPKKPLIVASHALRGLFVSLVALLFATGHLEVWMLFVFAFLNSTVESFAGPASSGLFQLIVPEGLYLEASSFSQSASSLAELVGLALSGVIIATLGIAGAIYIDAATFFFAAIGISTIRVHDDKPAPRVAGAPGFSGALGAFYADLKEGLRFVWNDKLIRITTILAAAANFALSPMSALQPAYVKEVLGSGPVGLSMLGIAFTVGIMLGSVALAKFGKDKKRISLILTGFLLVGILYAATALPVLIPASGFRLGFAVAVFFLIGGCLPLINATIGAYIMERTPKALVGRTSAVLGVACTFAMPMGAALSGTLAEMSSLPVIFLAMGLAILLLTLVVSRTQTVQAERRAKVSGDSPILAAVPVSDSEMA